MARARGPGSQVCDNSARVLSPLANGQPAVVRLVVAGEPDFYFVAEMPCDVDGARLFEVVGYRPLTAGHPDAVRRYAVFVYASRPPAEPRGHCTCAGGTLGEKRGPCRHLRSLSSLWQRGAL